MPFTAFVLLAQLAVPMRHTRPVLAFPERGIDDSVAYSGYQTRLFRDAAGNTVQVYVDQRAGRIVHLLADAEDESVGLSATDDAGRPVRVDWGGPGAQVGRVGRARLFEDRLVAQSSRLRLGAFLLGSMRVERDFQYAGQHHRPFGGTPFVLPEYARLVAALAGLPAPVQRRQLALLHATTLDELRDRLRPTLATRQDAATWVARIVQPALDARDTLVLEVRTDPRLVLARVDGDAVVLRARTGERVPFALRIATTGRTLTPLTRRAIFDPRFLAWAAAVRARAGASPQAALRAHWVERQVRGLELLVSREKVMAGLPNYATYFGRDMLLTALMMRPVWRDRMSELVLASALRKLSPQGAVSHEEAIGWQALREAAAEYATLVDTADGVRRAGHAAAADSLLARATAVLHDARRVRENYHMIDADFQLPVLAARWLTDPGVAAARKRAFLADAAETGEARLRRLLRELALVARATSAYVGNPVAANLVSFPRRDSTHWQSASWRDSNAGYANGRFAMDVNAIWAPHALLSIQRILTELRALGVPLDSVARTMPELGGDAPLARYIHDPRALQRALAVWRGSRRHFVVRLSPAAVRTRVTARLAAMPPAERRYWSALPSTAAGERDSLVLDALSLDGAGRPIDVANSDPATRLFLDGTDPSAAAPTGSSAAQVLRDVQLFVRRYPVGLLVDGVGPVAANDAYAPPAVWSAFEHDPYHGPRVVWGREVDLFLLGVHGMIDAGEGASHAAMLRDALHQVRRAVEGAGFRSELWSYEIADGRLRPVRYGTGSDVQLWSTADLAVQFALDGGRRVGMTAH